MKKQKKKIIIILFLLIILVFKSNSSFAEIDSDTLDSQEQTFGINSFIKNAKEYSGEFFSEEDINQILNSAINGKIDNSKIYKRILNLFGKELRVRNKINNKYFSNNNNT